ncbi:MAG: hypothetical protein OEX19_13595, partial [Gammaproteobacteria bacterium]|nr:hypothetical protein [Gammaproteobacteria bacterium]
MSDITRLSIDNSNLFKDNIGDGGVTIDEIKALSPQLDGLRKTIKGWLDSRKATFFNLPMTMDLEEIKRKGQRISGSYRRTIVFGIGGSSLGGEMLVRTLGDKNPRNVVSFYDNVDPSTLDELDDVDWSDTLLLVISKSGNTAETLSQFLTVLPTMEHQLGDEKIKDHVLVITENRDGALYDLAKRLKIEIIEHPPVGGRFCVLSVVGLLPAYIGGVDIDGVIEGARAMVERCSREDIIENPAFYNGAAQYLHSE